MADDWSIEALATQMATPTAGIGTTSTSACGSELWRYGMEQQQIALGTENLEADTEEEREARRMRIDIMVVRESVAGASRPRRRAWRRHSGGI